jgi:hypothetical protein
VFKTLLLFMVFAILLDDSSSIRKTEEEKREEKELAEKVNATLAEEEEKKRLEEEDEKKRKKKEEKTEKRKEDEGERTDVKGKDEACPPSNSSCPVVGPCPDVQDCPPKECGPCAPCGPCPKEKVCPTVVCGPCPPVKPCPGVNSTVDQPTVCQCPEVTSMSVPVAIAVGVTAGALVTGMATAVGLILRYSSPFVSGFLFVSIIILTWYLSSHHPEVARELGGRALTLLREAALALNNRVVEVLQRHREQVCVPSKPYLLPKNEFHVSKSLH